MPLSDPTFWFAVVEIIWINTLLSGDNAVVIAMACRGLEGRKRMWGMVLGAGVAILLRIAFTGIVSTLMTVPYLKIAGALALWLIAAKLIAPDEEGSSTGDATDSLWRAVKIVAVADIVMSLDNVIAIAAVAKGSWLLLVFGLAVSIPLIVAGSAFLMAVLDRFPLLVWVGAALLGWIAGDLLVSDPVLHGVIPSQWEHAAEWLAAAAGALLAVGLGWWMRQKHVPEGDRAALPKS